MRYLILILILFLVGGCGRYTQVYSRHGCTSYCRSLNNVFLTSTTFHYRIRRVCRDTVTGKIISRALIKGYSGCFESDYYFMREKSYYSNGNIYRKRKLIISKLELDEHSRIYNTKYYSVSGKDSVSTIDTLKTAGRWPWR